MRIRSHINGIKAGFKWWFINVFLCNFPSVRLRLFVLRRFGMRMNKNVKIYEGFHIREPQNITIKEGVSIGPHVLLDGRKGLTIGENAVLGYECIIWTLNHDYNDPNFCGKGAPVFIGDYAWICSRSIILPGITIGKGAVVASGAIVTKDVPPFTIVGGIPAKVIGRREEKKYSYGYKRSSDTNHFA